MSSVQLWGSEDGHVFAEWHKEPPHWRVRWTESQNYQHMRESFYRGEAQAVRAAKRRAKLIEEKNAAQKLAMLFHKAETDR